MLKITFELEKISELFELRDFLNSLEKAKTGHVCQEPHWLHQSIDDLELPLDITDALRASGIETAGD